MERQFKAALFERAVLTPASVSAPLRQSQPEALSVYKDAYMLEFLGLPTDHSEADLHCSLLLKTAQELLRHANSWITLDVYTR